MKAVIIGSGNVAEALTTALPKCGIGVVQLCARNAERGALLARKAGCDCTCGPRLAAADLYIAAVSDRAIGEVLAALEIPDEAVVVHVSGGQPLDAIPPKFAHRGVMWPLQTFTAGREVDFAEIPLFIESSDAVAAKVVDEVARRLSRRVFASDSAQRATLHTAAVFACNFANAMYAAGRDTAAMAGMDFDILKPLIAETARKAVAADDPRTVQTGPAVRGDTTTEERHKALLAAAGEAELESIYEKISRYIYGKKL